MAEVICYYCNNKFVKEKEPYETVYAKRYSHKKCYEIAEDLQDYLRIKLGEYYSYNKIRNNINQLTKQGYNLEDIDGAMRWWYDLKGGDPAKSKGGINIFSYIYPDYVEYKKNKEKIANTNVNKKIEDFIQEKEEYVIKPTPIKRPKRIKLFNFQ